MVGPSANKESKGKHGEERRGNRQRGSNGILATLSINATYRDLCLSEERRERRREEEEEEVECRERERERG